MLSWSKYVHDVSEQRRIKAIEEGETPPDIKGASNYERADLREKSHRAQHISAKEKWIGKSVGFGAPMIILIVLLTSHQS